jgi:predicted acetylornithine/succinylornithine family transaminase
VSVEATRRGAALLGVYRPAAPLFIGGRGSYLIADDGREFLDLTSGIAVNAFGYGDAVLTRTIEEAARRGVVHTSNLFRTAPALDLADELAARSFADRVFFCNSGAEANEAAFKFARRWARTEHGVNKHEIVALRGSFHGRLFASLAATDRPAYRAPFEPLLAGVRFIDPLDASSWGAAIDPARTAAIIAEPVQGEGGVRPLPAETLSALRSAADDAAALLIFDEVQCGLGRTGRLFAHEHSGVTPDLMTLAKPLAGGLPMGAVLLTEAVAATIQPGDHATTFGGGPLVASVALSTLRRVAEPSFLDRVAALGQELHGWLRALPSERVSDVRGAGLMWGVQTVEPAAAVIARAFEAGVLLVAAGEHVVRIVPPLNISATDLAAGIAVLREALN